MMPRKTNKPSAEKTVRDIRRATRRRYSAEEKIRIVLEGLRGQLAGTNRFVDQLEARMSVRLETHGPGSPAKYARLICS
jgi:hypothetical protein